MYSLISYPASLPSNKTLSFVAIIFVVPYSLNIAPPTPLALLLVNEVSVIFKALSSKFIFEFIFVIFKLSLADMISPSASLKLPDD